MKKNIFILAFLLWPFIHISSQTICGYIYDKDDNPVHLASVSIDGYVESVYSNLEGYFSLKNAKEGSSILKIRSMGFEESLVVVGDSCKDCMIVRLKEKDNFLNTVVVTGTRTQRTLKDTPVLTKVISSADIKDIGAVTVFDALESLVPSIHFNPDAHGDNIQIQGLDNKYILILIDGERVVPERAENVNFSRLNVADIERIEILNGASSVLYGSNAIGAVINIITKRTNKPFEGFVQGRHKKYKTYNADAGISFNVKGLSSKTGFNYKTTDGYDLSPDSPTIYTVNPNDDYSFTQTFGYKFNDKIDAEVTGRYYEHETNNPPLSANTTHNLEKNYTVTGKLNYKTSDKNILTFSGHSDIFKQHVVYEKRNDSTGLKSDYYYTTFRLTDTWTPSKKFQIIGGYEYNRENSFSTTLYGVEPGENSSHNNNLFSQANFRILDNLESVAGLRLTDHSGFGSHLSPSVSLMYKIKDFRFRGGANNGFKAPSLKEMYYNFDMGGMGMFDLVGNPDLKTETSWYEFVSGEYINSDFNMSVTLFHNRISDKISYKYYTITDENTGADKRIAQYENLEDVRILGIDASIQWNFLNYFNVKGAYTYSDAKDLATNTQIGGNSKHNITSILSFKYSKLKIGANNYPFTLSLSGRYNSPRIQENVTTNPDGSVTTSSNNSKAFSIWRFVYTQKIPVIERISAEVQVGVDNLFDYVVADDKNTFAFVNPGRTFSIMARINF